MKLPFWCRIRALHVAAAAVCLIVTAACASQRQASVSTSKPANFQAYVQESRQWIRHQRRFQTKQEEDELTWNAPFELRPAVPTRKGLLLFHGLGDSPWSFVDIAQELASQGYAVRTALLPGHGTQPADLIGVRLEDWQRLVREQVALLREDFPEVYLGGFSTGANLVLEYAMNDLDVRGLVLFSPALRSSESFDWAMPLLAHVKTWLFEPDGLRPQQSPVRYLNVPSNGFAQFYRSTVAVRRLIEHEDFDRPVIVVLAEHDSVVDVSHVRKLFDRRFTHSASRLIWYGQDASPPGSSRILVRTDRLPHERISQFSHMGILFSPHNLLYGRSGIQRLCWNGQTEEDTARCNAGEPALWFSDWGHREHGKVHARLTFNPYFDWQSRIIRDVLKAAEPATRITRD